MADKAVPVEPRPNPIFFPNADSAGVAFLPGNSLPSLAVGNPIHVATGNKYQAETDLPALPGVLGLAFSRHYNSAAATSSGVFGAGWRHALEARVLVDQPRDGQMRLIQADGRAISFSRTGTSKSGMRQYRGVRASDGDLLVTQAGAYRWRWPDGRELVFDDLGKLTSIAARGERLRLLYQDERLIRVTDPQRRDLTFSYYPNGRVSRIAGPAGFAARYRYDGAGNLAEVVYSDATARLYGYDAPGLPHHLTSIAAHRAPLAELGRRERPFAIAAWTYDERGRAISSTHPQDSGKVALDYGDGRTDVTDALGRVTRYEYEWIDGTARITSVRGPGCGACGVGDVRYVYGKHFTLTGVHTAHQPSLHYRYDEEGRLAQVERTDLAGAREWLIRLRYDGESRRPTLIERPSINPQGLHSARLRFDARGNPTHVTEIGYSPTASGAFEPIERTSRFTFDRHGRLTSMDGPRTDVIDVTRFEHDEHGRLAGIRTPNSRAMRVSQFDAAGRITALDIDAQQRTEIDYDTRGRIRSVTRKAGAVRRSLRYHYDALGRLTKTTDDSGRARQFKYDQANRLNDISIGALHERHVYATDDLPLRASLVTSSGHALRTLYFAYDAQRRLIETRDGSGPPLQQVRYLDADNRPDRILDPLGAETILDYDTLGRLNHIRAPDGGLTRFQFDWLQRLRSVTAPNGAHTSYQYDDFGRRVEEDSPDRGRLRYAYDAAGHLTRKTDARGLATHYRYDAGGRLTRIEQHDDATDIRYRDGRIVAISNAHSTEHRKYDDSGRLLEHSRRIGGHAFTTTYEYDSAGRLIAKRLPSGTRLVHTYDAKGALIGVRSERLFKSQLLLGSDDATSSAPPLSAHRLGDLRLGNGLVTRTRLDLESGGTAYRATDGVTRFSYQRDPSGRIIGIDTPTGKTSYAYDAAGRLIAARRPDETLTYEYDTNGNRTASTHTTSTGTTHTQLRYTANSNRLQSIARSDTPQPIHYTYDRSGNPLTAGPWRYEYDTNGRLRNLYYANALRAQYAYNAHGERVQKDVYGNGKRERTFFLYENHQLIAEANEHGRVTREYFYLGHHPVVMMEEGRVYWIHTDHLGTPRALTDGEARTVWSTSHEPFGMRKKNARMQGPSAFGIKVGLPGQLSDQETGLSYNISRFYDPYTGRYLESDPMGLSAGTNTFAYVSNSPLMRVDPLGLYEEDVHYYMTFFLAITAGLTPESAQRIALANAFLDLNPYTRPMNGQNAFTTVASIQSNQPQLLRYHFVLSDPATGLTLSTYDNTITHRPFSQPSPQMQALLSYATDSPKLLNGQRSPCNSEHIQLQFFGEFLHAFEDTFAHRDSNDRPFDALNLGQGFGHGLAGHNPDFTYNSGSWRTRETRTLSMELDTRDLLRSSPWADQSRATSDEQLDLLFQVLREFNAITENEHNLESDWTGSKKVARLNRGLRELGYDGIDLSSDAYRFNAEAAFQNRFNAFLDLDPTQYRNGILETARGE